MGKIIYLDNAATTKVSEETIREMQKYLGEEFGNASSIHEMGENSRKAIWRVRKEIAQELGCREQEIIFTSGSSESNNMAFFGLTRSTLGRKKKKILISSIEHSSIFEICEELKKEGFEVKEIGVDKEGMIDIEEFEQELDGALLASVIHASNEIGVIQNLREIGKICRKKGVYFHTDSAQSFGKLKINVNEAFVDLLSAGAHKFGGPKGVGFLFLREGIKLNPLILGGGQEGGLRGGTENVSGIAGMGKALELSRKTDWKKVEVVRNYFIEKLEETGWRINGSKENRIWGNVNAFLRGINGEMAVLALSRKGIMCSTGSACDSRKKSESKVLKAIGLSEEEIKGSLRFSLGADIGKKEIDTVMKELGLFVSRLL